MSTLRPYGLWLVTLALRTGCRTEYLATRTVAGLDPDDVSARALAAEVARQEGVRAAGGDGHAVLGVRSLRRVLGGRVR